MPNVHSNSFVVDYCKLKGCHRPVSTEAYRPTLFSGFFYKVAGGVGSIGLWAD